MVVLIGLHSKILGITNPSKGQCKMYDCKSIRNEWTTLKRYITSTMGIEPSIRSCVFLLY